MRKIIEVKIVKGGEGLPIVCPICKQAGNSKDYLVFYYEGNPNGFCVHSDCAATKIFADFWERQYGKDPKPL